MNKKIHNVKTLKLAYYFSSAFAFIGGISIYAFFRNINNMILFQFIHKPSFLTSLYIQNNIDSIWFNMFIYNLTYGFWCLSGLLLIRAIWLNNTKWRVIYGLVFIAIVMSYVLLKLPGIIPGTFDILDLLFMGFFAFLESLIFNMFIRRKIV